MLLFFYQEKGLYYDPKSGTYFYYNKSTGKYEFHSQVDLSYYTPKLHGYSDRSHGSYHHGYSDKYSSKYSERSPEHVESSSGKKKKKKESKRRDSEEKEPRRRSSDEKVCILCAMYFCCEKYIAITCTVGLFLSLLYIISQIKIFFLKFRTNLFEKTNL